MHRNHRLVLSEQTTVDLPAPLVVKVGGSLLVRPDLPQTLRHWLLSCAGPGQVNLLVGGGAMIDSLRELDRIHRLDAVAMHWRCVRALRHTTELVAGWFPEAGLIETEEAFARHRLERRPGWFFVAPEAFYHRDSGDRLPCDWTMTSDSIAALLARRLAAERLVLLKTCQLPERLTLTAAVAEGIVDPVLPQLVDQGTEVSLVSLAPSLPHRDTTSGAAVVPTGNRS